MRPHVLLWSEISLRTHFTQAYRILLPAFAQTFPIKSQHLSLKSRIPHCEFSHTGSCSTWCRRRFSWSSKIGGLRSLEDSEVAGIRLLNVWGWPWRSRWRQFLNVRPPLVPTSSRAREVYTSEFYLLFSFVNSSFELSQHRFVSCA